MGKSYFAAPATEQQSPFVADQSQQRVLDLPVQTSAVIWGAPGSGKTRTLIELVAQRVAEGQSPDHLLVLSPNRQAATRLRDQLSSRIGRISQNALARTPNSLAFSILTALAVRQGKPAPRLLTGGEQDSMIRDLLEGDIESATGPVWPEPLVSEVRMSRAFRNELRELFARSTELGWDADQLGVVAKRSGHPQWRAAAQFWIEYDDAVNKRRENYLDSATLLRQASQVIEGSLDEIIPGLTTVLIDDAQEMTYGAIRMVAALVKRGVTVIAFGDPDISASTFRGAYPHFLGRFADLLGLPSEKVDTIVFEKVHRHPAAIRALVEKVTGHIGVAHAGRQHQASSVATSDSSMPELVTLQASSPHEETVEIARILREHAVVHGVGWNKMAVIVRNSSLVPHFARSLSVSEVPTRTLVAERSLRDQAIVADLAHAIKLAERFDQLTWSDQAEQFAQFLLSPLVGLTGIDVRRLRLALRHVELTEEGVKSGSQLLAEAAADTNKFDAFDFAPARAAKKAAITLHTVKKQVAEHATIEELLWTVWHNSGLVEAWAETALGTGLLADDANRNLDAVLALFTAATRFTERSPERSPVEFIDELLSADIPDDTLAPMAQRDSVLVATPAAVIGAEYDIVVVASVQENVWPNLKPRGSLLDSNELTPDFQVDSIDARTPSEKRASARKSVLDDELRYFSLAISRAKKQVVVSAIVQEDSLPSPLFELAEGLTGDDTQLSGSSDHPLSLRGLVGSLRRQLVSGQNSKNEAAAIARLAREGIPGADPATWYGLIETSTDAPLFDLADPQIEIPVSPSKLDSWQDNQLAWFIDTVIGYNKSSAQGIGTIVHKVMEDASTIPGKSIEAGDLFAAVTERWNELSFEAEWLSEKEKNRVALMAEALSRYLKNFQAEGKELVQAEGGFTLPIGPATVRGYIDRIERDALGTVVIVDLKTGKTVPSGPETQKHTQLACYQLALVDGAIEWANPADGTKVTNGGAKLLFLTDGKKYGLFKEMAQSPQTQEQLDAMRTQIITWAQEMATHQLKAKLILREQDGDSSTKYEYRIHTVQAVSSL